MNESLTILNRLSRRHDALVAQWDLVSYAIDLRSAFPLSDSLIEHPLLGAYYEIGLADLREEMLLAIDGVLQPSTVHPVLAGCRPLCRNWWISLSQDGREAAYVASRLAELACVLEEPTPGRMRWFDQEAASLGCLLDGCERALAAARACLAAYDLKAVVASLFECESTQPAVEQAQ